MSEVPLCMVAIFVSILIKRPFLSGSEDVQLQGYLAHKKPPHPSTLHVMYFTALSSRMRRMACATSRFTFVLR